MQIHAMREFTDEVPVILASRGFVDPTSTVASFQVLVLEQGWRVTVHRYASIVARVWDDGRLIAEGWGASEEQALLAAFAQWLNPRPPRP